jgi:uncharacterized protein
MVERGSIEVEVVYALPKTQTIVPLVVPVGTTVGEVLSQSGMAARHPEIDIYSMRLGIYGKRMSLTTVLENHDRIEICRPLIVDPKQARRARAALKKKR